MVSSFNDVKGSLSPPSCKLLSQKVKVAQRVSRSLDEKARAFYVRPVRSAQPILATRRVERIAEKNKSFEGFFVGR